MSDWFNHVAAATTATDGPAGDGNIPTSGPGVSSIDGGRWGRATQSCSRTRSNHRKMGRTRTRVHTPR